MDLEDLLLRLGSGAVLGTATWLLALPARAGLADVRPDEDGVALRAAQALLGHAVYVQRGGGVAARLKVRGERHRDGVETGGLVRPHARPFGSQCVEPQVLRGLRLTSGLHHAEDVEGGGDLHRGGLRLVLEKVTAGGLACLEGPVAHAVGQGPAAIHSQAVPVWGHMHILRLQAQVQLGHVLQVGVLREAGAAEVTVKVAWTDLGQVFTTGVQIVVAL